MLICPISRKGVFRLYPAHPITPSSLPCARCVSCGCFVKVVSRCRVEWPLTPETRLTCAADTLPTLPGPTRTCRLTVGAPGRRCPNEPRLEVQTPPHLNPNCEDCRSTGALRCDTCVRKPLTLLIIRTSRYFRYVSQCADTLLLLHGQWPVSPSPEVSDVAGGDSARSLSGRFRPALFWKRDHAEGNLTVMAFDANILRVILRVLTQKGKYNSRLSLEKYASLEGRLLPVPSFSPS